MSKRSVVVVDEGNTWLMINDSRAESPITIPTITSELTTPSELTTDHTTSTSKGTAHRLTHTEKQAQKDAEEDLKLANNHFERISRRQRIHEYAVHRHLKHPTKGSLRLVIDTFDNLYQSEMQVPPPLCTEASAFDAKAAIARGREGAFSVLGTVEAERAWAYGYPYTDGEAAEHYQSEATWAEDITNQVLSTTEGRRRDVLEEHHSAFPTSLEDAKLALECIKNIAERLRPRQECEFVSTTLLGDSK
ncbi:hypothetical protein C8F04DRAFT_1200849 [Mycena alexandri]|uniref:Uncharacterized protein n=1 Tax=Mycena alexandri TaxID=1745969 RepID=A0AAD6RZI6_9AGAR|nr:hypothetical protein C8F04DRAFT_1200849 [Mycena alexandri]